MKINNIIATCFFLLSCTISFSQGVSVGIIAGPNVTHFWGSNLGIDHPAVNYVAGISAEYAISDDFSILALPTYEVKGNAFIIGLTDEAGNLIGQFKAKNNLNYLTMPVLAEGKFGKKAKVLVNAGPYVGYLLNAVFKGAGMDPTINVIETTQNFKRMDFGATFGVGIDIPLDSQLHLSFMFSNSLGLNKISSSFIAQSEIKNNATSLLVGLSYKLGKVK